MPPRACVGPCSSPLSGKISSAPPPHGDAGGSKSKSRAGDLPVVLGAETSITAQPYTFAPKSRITQPALPGMRTRPAGIPSMSPFDCKDLTRGLWRNMSFGRGECSYEGSICGGLCERNDRRGVYVRVLGRSGILTFPNCTEGSHIVRIDPLGHLTSLTRLEEARRVAHRPTPAANRYRNQVRHGGPERHAPGWVCSPCA